MEAGFSSTEKKQNVLRGSELPIALYGQVGLDDHFARVLWSKHQHALIFLKTQLYEKSLECNGGASLL